MLKQNRLLPRFYVLFILAFFSQNAVFTYAETVRLPERGLCAHRGDQYVGPENTVPAFIGAVEAGAQQIELDVQKTKDGKLVVMHDSTVDRTTNGKGAILDLTLDEIKALDVKTSDSCVYTNIKVPTFEEALDCLPNNIWINVHVKPGEGIAEDALKVVIEKGRLEQAFFAVRKTEMDSLRKICPEVKICCMEQEAGPEKYVQYAIDWNCDFIQLWEPYTAAQIAALKAANIKINYFGTDDHDKIRQLIEDGVDFPLVNFFGADWPAAKDFDGFKLTEVSQEYRDKANALVQPIMPKRGLCAHRGDQGIAPENTIPALLEAVKAGAQQVEFDVQRTKDGRLVVTHDLMVDRTTTGKGYVKDLTFDEIRSFDAGIKYDAKYAGLKVPTFEEVLDCLPRNVWLNIHVKAGEKIAADATRVVVAKNRLAQSFIGVESKEELDEARAVCPDVKIAYIVFVDGNLNQTTVDNAIAWNCQFVQFTGYSPEFVKQLKDANILLNFFGTDDPEKIRSLLNDGIDFPLVNNFQEDWAASKDFKELKDVKLNNLDPNYINATK